MNEDDLRERLRALPPGAPDPAGWADAASRTARRRAATRRMAALGVVVLGLGAWGWAAQPWARTGVPAASATPGVVGAADCSSIGDGPDARTPTQVPPGASSVRLCDTSADGLRRAVPAEPLTTGLDDLAEAINAGAAPGIDQACTADLGPRYTLVFAYPGGRRVAVSGEMYGCGLVGGHLSGREVGRRVTELAQAARRVQSPPPTSPPAPDCAAASWVRPDIAGTGAAALCYASAQGVSSRVAIEGWAALASAAARASTQADPAAELPAPVARIVAASPFGDVTTIDVRPGSLSWWGEDAAGRPLMWRWVPTAQEWSAIQAAFEKARDAGTPALCAHVDAPPLSSLEGAQLASRCVRDAAGIITEYPLGEKLLELVRDEARPGIPPPQRCPAPPNGEVETLVVRRADGSVGVLTYDCRGYLGKDFHWTPTAGERSWLLSLPPR